MVGDFFGCVCDQFLQYASDGNRRVAQSDYYYYDDDYYDHDHDHADDSATRGGACSNDHDCDDDEFVDLIHGSPDDRCINGHCCTPKRCDALVFAGNRVAANHGVAGHHRRHADDRHTDH